ncbi:MAG: protein rep [bacterium]|jgi:Plasmid rolling circle replication initiator protein and truncated derivatives
MLKSNYNKQYKKDTKKSQEKSITINHKSSEIYTLYKYKRDFLDLLSDRYLEIAKQENNAEFQNWGIKLFNCFDYFQAGIFTNNIQKIFKVHSCQDRLCLACNHRRSLRTFAKLIQIVKNESMQKYRYLHVVLTIKNCTPDQLTQTINTLLYSFEKFLKNKRIKNINKGFFRSLEITYNEINKSFHPHLHLLIAVNPSYFKNTKFYIKHADFAEIWRKSANLNYFPQVSIQALKINDYAGIAEVAKYAVKESEELIKNIPLNDLKILRLNLRKRRLISVGGIIRDMAKILKLNLDDDNLITDSILDDNIKDETLKFIVEFLYNRKLKKYKLKNKEKVEF